MNPTDSQLPKQPEVCGVKGQVQSVRMVEVAKRNAKGFEAGMTLDEFCKRYNLGLEVGNVTEGGAIERVQQAQTAFGLTERDLALGQHKVSYIQYVVRLNGS